MKEAILKLSEILFFITCLLFVSTCAYSSETVTKSATTCCSANIPFVSGEKLLYDVYLYISPVGKFSLVYNGIVYNSTKPMIHITAITDVVGFYDKEEIYGDPETFLPIRVERLVKQYGTEKNLTEYYNHETNSVRIMNSDTNEEIESIKKSSPLQNVILLYYFFRTQELKIKDEFAYNLPTEEGVVTVKKKKNIKVPYNSCETFYLKAKPNILEIWVSTQPEPLPMKIKLKTLLANYNLELKEIGTP
jgi:hypothetical protein